MSDSASYRSIRDQLVSITVDIEDKARVCDLLERNIEKERQLLASAETSVKEEYERILEAEVQAHKQTTGRRTQESQQLVQEKRDLIAQCNDLVARVTEQEHDLKAEVRAVYRDAEAAIESEKKLFRSGYEERLQKFLQAKTAEYKENAARALHPNITRLQMQHEQEMNDVERSLQAQERSIRETLNTQLQARLEEERVATKEELKLTLRALQDKAEADLDMAKRDHRKALQRLTDDGERDIEQHRLYLRDKAQRGKDRNHHELRQAQEGCQQRLLELQQRHSKHIEALQREHEQEMHSLRQQAERARKAQQAEVRRGLTAGSGSVGSGVRREFDDSDNEGEEDGMLSAGRHSSSARSRGSAGAFSPRKSPHRKGSAGSQPTTGGSLLEYSEFTDDGSSLAMEHLDLDADGAAEAELELAALVRSATQDRDRQIQAEIRALESETLRLERQWRAKAEQDEKQALAAVAKEEELLTLRRGAGRGGNSAGAGDDVAELVVQREQLMAKVQVLQAQVDKAEADLRDANQEVAVYRDGIAAHRARIHDKQEQHRLALREVQLEVGPQLRELREQCDQTATLLREAAERARAQLAALEKDHAAALSALDRDVKSTVAQRDEEMAALREACETEEAKIARLQRLIGQYSNKSSAGDGGSSAGKGRGAGDVGDGGDSVGAVSRTAVQRGGGGGGGSVVSGVSTGGATRATSTSSQRLAAHQKLKPAVPAQRPTSQGAAVRRSGSGVRSGGSSGTAANGSDIAGDGGGVRQSGGMTRPTSAGMRASRGLHATHSAATTTASATHPDSDGEEVEVPRRPTTALHRTAPVRSTATSSGDGVGRYGDSEGSDTDEEPQPVPAWLKHRQS